MKQKRFLGIFLSFVFLLISFSCSNIFLETTKISFNFNSSNISREVVGSKEIWVVDAKIEDVNGVILQEQKIEVEKGSSADIHFRKIPTYIEIKIKLNVFEVGETNATYIGESDWFLTKPGNNNVEIVLEKNQIKVTLPTYSEIPTLSEPVVSGNNVKFTAPVNYVSYEWFVDGEKQEGATSFSFNLDTSEMGGFYTIMVVVTDKDGNIYSAEYQLLVNHTGYEVENE